MLAQLGCQNPEPENNLFFERRIQPILTASCVGNTAGCHRDNGNGEALGNLDLSSFQAATARRDVLTRSGSYPEALLLIKAAGSVDQAVQIGDQTLPLLVDHGGGPILDVRSEAYFELKRWLDNGATEDGAPPKITSARGTGACNAVTSDRVDPTTVASDAPGLAAFRDLQPRLVESCGAGSCHGHPLADFALTCGSDDAQTRANYLMARAFVASNVADSELLIRPLDPTRGGVAHGGGALWASRDDADYQRLHAFAVAAGPLVAGTQSPARSFFDTRVMPVLVQKGCALTGCHSPLVPNKLKLRGGSLGFFSVLALDENYHEVRDLFLALGANDVRRSRAGAKNLTAAHGGIAHRAGALLEPDVPCAATYDPATATPLCTLAEWHRLERAELPASELTNLAAGQRVPLVYVERPADAVGYTEFARYRPGADLVRVDVILGAGGPSAPGGRQSLLAGCGVGAAGSGGALDVRAPDVSPDATRVLFALRGASGGLDVWMVGLDGSNCHKVTSDGGGGLGIDNFDPLWVVDAGIEWVVYASTRGGTGGPVRTPRLTSVDADLWRQPVAGGTPERMTFVRGVESQPALMAVGQLTMTAEKQTADFYQVAGRRLNWDLSDYHPLLAQRRDNYTGRGGYLPGTAPATAALKPSMGYDQATEIREAMDGNFLVVLADGGTLGEGGALGVFNRSIGPFEQGRSDLAFVQSLRVLPGPTGRRGQATGAYRSPVSLPDGMILASYAAGVDVGAATPVSYDLVVVDPISGDRRVLLAGAQSEVEAVLATARPAPKPLRVRPIAPGATATTALVHFPDLPLLATLLDSNSRHGRDVTPLRAATRARFFTHASPPLTCMTPTDAPCAGAMAAPMGVYEARRDVGSAPLQRDGSLFVKVPAGVPVLLELLDARGQVLFRQREDNTFGPSESIGVGVPAASFNSMCAGCHGSISGRELEVHVDIDAVTHASSTLARAAGVRELDPP